MVVSFVINNDIVSCYLDSETFTKLKLVMEIH